MLKNLILGKFLQKFHKFKPSPFTEQRAQSIYFFLFFSLQISILNQNFEDFEEKQRLKKTSVRKQEEKALKSLENLKN